MEGTVPVIFLGDPGSRHRVVPASRVPVDFEAQQMQPVSEEVAGICEAINNTEPRPLFFIQRPNTVMKTDPSDARITQLLERIKQLEAENARLVELLAFPAPTDAAPEEDIKDEESLTSYAKQPIRPDKPKKLSKLRKRV